ncbi:Carboxy-terminal processing protease CtpA precursor [Rickettsiales bacterium Ac37b]|nr:Carboxy-terminal processing protease CtpA precursor [Rickettsiales bacterium Ac37b]
MKKMRLSLLVLCIVCFAGLGSTLAQKSSTNNVEAIKLLSLYGDVLEKVKKDYVVEISDKDLIEASINGMLSSLDPHSGYLDEKSFEEMKVQTKGEFGGLGMEVTVENGFVKVISPIDDTPAFQIGIKNGDYIISIDDESVTGMTLTEAVKKMRGKAGSKVKLTILREGNSEPLEFNITRKIIKVTPVKTRIEANNIGYVRINSFSEQTAEAVKNILNKMKSDMSGKLQGIVLDLRNNPGGLLNQAIEVTELFLARGEIVSTRGRSKDSVIRYNASNREIITGIPIVVLINGGSASAAEIVAGALQDHKRAIIMGTKSFGKGSVQSIINIPEYGAIKLTTARYYTPSGRSIQAEGIVPDISVEPAKIEFIEKNDTVRLYSEAKLRGHLRNENDSNKQLQSIAVETSETKKSLYEQDYQLARAIDLLKGMNIFNQAIH